MSTAQFRPSKLWLAAIGILFIIAVVLLINGGNHWDNPDAWGKMKFFIGGGLMTLVIGFVGMYYIKPLE